MSLILEALRKLEAEKQAPERGFLVVAAPSWPDGGKRTWPWLVATALLVGGLAIGGALWLRPRGVASLPEPRPVPAAVPAAAPAAAPAAVTPPPASPEPFREPAPALAHREETKLVAPVTMPRPRGVASAPASPATAPSPPALVLEAISERDGRPIALVSDHLVREGDAFDGVTIVRIGEAEVEVEWRGQRRILHF
jgi:hypothetical protein